MNFVGIDQHLKFSYITIMDKEGTVLQQRKVENDKKEINKVLKPYLRARCCVALEAGPTWYWLVDFLQQKKAEVSLVHPLKVKAIATSKIKTDKIDSKILADLLRGNLLPTAYIPTLEERFLREFLRQRTYLVRKQTSVKNRIFSILAKNNIKNPMSDPFGKEGLRFIEKLNLGFPYCDNLNSSLRVLQSLKDEIGKIDKRVVDIAKVSPKVQRLASLPGIGVLSSLTIVSEVGTVLRFRNARSLCSYSGLVPSVYQSGQKNRYGRITKQGSKTLRWILIEAAQKAKDNPRYKDFYQRLAKRRGPSVAKVALARKMLTHIYHILKEEELNIADRIEIGQARAGDTA